ncbi:MAG: hypothetical protein HY038_10240, partial [Nitrospirae bacterium]|nr:hypothetical protein [Nitrospirota bacterium]
MVALVVVSSALFTGTVIAAEPSKFVPLIALVVVSFAALPVVFWLRVGTSVAAIARNEGAPAEPLGPAKKYPWDVVVTPTPPSE